MTSQALAGLLRGVDEVRALRTHYPKPKAGIAAGTAAVGLKAHGRACVVLLSSHLERYVRAVNEEAFEWLNAQSLPALRLPEDFRLVVTRGPIDDLASISWEKRAPKLQDFAAGPGSLFTAGAVAGNLDHRQLLSWMKSPKPELLVRFYKYYGIVDIFSAVTRKASTRSVLWLDVRELVEKRNNIAHGDYQTEALAADVARYLVSVSKFASSADRALARQLRRVAASASDPW